MWYGVLVGVAAVAACTRGKHAPNTAHSYHQAHRWVLQHIVHLQDALRRLGPWHERSQAREEGGKAVGKVDLDLGYFWWLRFRCVSMRGWRRRPRSRIGEEKMKEP